MNYTELEKLREIKEYDPSTVSDLEFLFKYVKQLENCIVDIYSHLEK